MTSLVTGATGFIGRRLVRRLIEVEGPEAVVCLVKPAAHALEAEALDAFRARGLRLLDGDLRNRPVCADPPPRVDRVFHLAANIDTDAAEPDLLVNHEGTRNLLEWLQPVSNGVRIVYASSVAVHDRDSEPRGPIDEHSPLVPRTAYGKTKLLGEQVLRERAAAGGYAWTILRLPTVYGPGQKAGGLFDTMLELASNGGLLGRIDWPGRTSIIHVDDVAAAMIELSTLPDAAGEIFCVASDESLTVGELARGIGHAIGRPIRPVPIPRALLGAARAVVWNRTAPALLPRSAQLPFWRLSLIVSDGFWFDTTKFRRVYEGPLRNLDRGLEDVVPPRDAARRL
ncbi:MAG TPA: NAD-dependent epimerase/dehydratase family protein [Vicinamibacterales bacterium]|nr:NAD-dependent epimerase/dehydratase family protein [Vicinamibacterales bacterium]